MSKWDISVGILLNRRKWSGFSIDDPQYNSKNLPEWYNVENMGESNSVAQHCKITAIETKLSRDYGSIWEGVLEHIDSFFL